MADPDSPSVPRSPYGRRSEAGFRLQRRPGHTVRNALARACLRLSSCLPLSAGQRAGDWLAPLVLRFPGRVRDSIATNLALCFPDLGEAERRRLARESLAESIAAMLELGPLWHWGQARVLSLVREVDGLERLDAAVASGRGAVILGPHLGAWEIAGLFASSRAAMTTLYRPPRVPGLERCLARARGRFGARLVPADARGVRALFRTLQRGGVVGLLPDQDPGPGAGVFAPFFGVPARTSTLAVRLLRSTAATPILSWAERLERGQGYRLHYVEPDPGPLRCGDLERATRALNLEIERLVRRLPRQYLWTYRRFRRPPPGQRNPYRRDGVASVAAQGGSGSAVAP